MACWCGSAIRFTIRPSASASRPVEHRVVRAHSASHAPRSSSALGRARGTRVQRHDAARPSLLRMKNASPIGMSKLAHRSSERTRSGSHAMRVPTGRYSRVARAHGPARLARAVDPSLARAAACGGAPRGSPVPQRSQRSPVARGAAGGRGRTAARGLRGQPTEPADHARLRRADSAWPDPGRPLDRPLTPVRRPALAPRRRAAAGQGRAAARSPSAPRPARGRSKRAEQAGRPGSRRPAAPSERRRRTPRRR